ncbi:MAG: ABC transporter permease, partial [Pseudomonadota bacterium]
MKRLARVRAILVKEIRQLGRDRLTFALVAGLPIMQLLLFGYAINTDVRNLGAVVVDQAGTSLSRELTNAVRATQVVEIERELAAPADVEAGLKAGKFVVGIVIPPDFDRRLARGDEPAAQLLVDGSDPTIFGVARQLTAMPLALDTARRSEPAAPVFE